MLFHCLMMLIVLRQGKELWKLLLVRPLVFVIFINISLDLNLVLVDELGMEILPYAVLLVVPLLGRMSDQEDDVRLLATQSFASLVKLMPLEVSSLM